MSSQSDLPIPKFLSFKPKPAEPLADDHTSSRANTPSRGRHHDSDSKERRHRSGPTRYERDKGRDRDKEYEKDRTRGKERERDRDRDKGRGKERDRGKDRNRDLDRDQTRDIRVESNRLKRSASTQESSSRQHPTRPTHKSVHDTDHHDLYILDVRGEPQNAIYGTCDKYKVPPYRRHGFGNVLGLPKNLRIDRNLSDDRGIVINISGSTASGGVRPLLRKQNVHTRPRRLKQVKGETDSGQPDFIQVSKKPEELDLIAARQPSFTMHDSDLDSDADDTQDAGRSRARGIQQNTEALTKRVSLEPKNVWAWLDLVDHQVEVVSMDKADGAPLSGSERRNLADVRLSILESALSKVAEDDPNIIKLILRVLDEGSTIWDFKAVSKKRSAYLRKYPDNFDLWMSHINNTETDVVLFTYDGCLKIYRTILERFSSGRRKASDSRILYIFVRLTRMVYAAGYQELSIALWQSVLEFYFFAPVNPTVTAFEEFWEDEALRIGEAGALGWYTFPDNQSGIVDEGTESHTAPVFGVGEFGKFGTEESNYMDSNVLPSRALDDPDDEDPFRTIMFSDIEPYLKALDCNLDPQLLLQAFLCYCSLPPLGCPPTDLRQFWIDPFLRRESLDSALQQDEIDNCTAGSFSYSLHQLKEFPFQSKVFDTSSLFSGAFQHVKRCSFNDWALRVVKALGRRQTSNHELQEYAVAFDLHYTSSASATKFAKNMLKQNQSNLRLYNAVSIASSKAGRTEEANRIMGTALSMCSDSSADTIILWNTWIWDALNRGDQEQAIARVLSIGMGRPLDSRTHGEVQHLVTFPAVDVLRCQNHLLIGFQNSVSSSLVSVSAAYADCFALVAYLRSGGDFEAAMNAYTDIKGYFPSVGHSTPSTPSRLAPTASEVVSISISELIEQHKCRLMVRHIRLDMTCKPSVMRSFLSSAIKMYPSNTDFFLLYMANESRFRLDDRVRTLFRELEYPDVRSSVGPSTDNGVSTKGVSSYSGPFVISQSILTPGLRVWSELHRHAHLGRTIHSVRAAFESGLQTDSPSGPSPSAPSPSACPSSPSLWFSYLCYELVVAKDVQRAKKVYFRGIRALPGHKRFLMAAFEMDELRTALSREQLGGMYRMLEEKNMRVHWSMEADAEEAAKTGMESEMRDE